MLRRTNIQRDIYMERPSTQKDIHMKEKIHKGTYTRRKHIHADDIYLKE